jgi:excisionase family DNA binding protein
MTDTPLQDRAAYSIAEFCGTHGIGRSTVYELINNGRLTARKLGKRTLIMRSDAEAFLSSLPKINGGGGDGH